MNPTQPDYKLIYNDILQTKFPEKAKECLPFLKKKTLSAIDILELNKKVFGRMDEKSFTTNQKYRSYKESDIIKILDYQKKNQFNNSELARHFKLSRNTVAKWRKIFLR